MALTCMACTLPAFSIGMTNMTIPYPKKQSNDDKKETYVIIDKNIENNYIIEIESKSKVKMIKKKDKKKDKKFKNKKEYKNVSKIYNINKNARKYRNIHQPGRTNCNQRVQQ